MLKTDGALAYHPIPALPLRSTCRIPPSAIAHQPFSELTIKLHTVFQFMHSSCIVFSSSSFAYQPLFSIRLSLNLLFPIMRDWHACGLSSLGAFTELLGLRLCSLPLESRVHTVYLFTSHSISNFRFLYFQLMQIAYMLFFQSCILQIYHFHYGDYVPLGFDCCLFYTIRFISRLGLRWDKRGRTH